jgi:hypothetical protein
MDGKRDITTLRFRSPVFAIAGRRTTVVSRFPRGAELLPNEPERLDFDHLRCGKCARRRSCRLGMKSVNALACPGTWLGLCNGPRRVYHIVKFILSR